MEAMEATAACESHMAAAVPPLDFTVTVCAAMLRSGCGLNWGEGCIGWGLQNLLLLLLVALRLLRS